MNIDETRYANWLLKTAKSILKAKKQTNRLKKEVIEDLSQTVQLIGWKLYRHAQKNDQNIKLQFVRGRIIRAVNRYLIAEQCHGITLTGTDNNEYYKTFPKPIFKEINQL